MKLVYEKGSAFDIEYREVNEKLREVGERARQNEEKLRQNVEQSEQTVRSLIGLGFSDREIINITGFPLDDISGIRAT